MSSNSNNSSIAIMIIATTYFMCVVHTTLFVSMHPSRAAYLAQGHTVHGRIGFELKPVTDLSHYGVSLKEVFLYNLGG